MEIPEEFINSLESFADSKRFSGPVFNKLIEYTFNILVKKSTEQELADDTVFSNTSPSILKSIYASLVSYTLENSKHNADPLAITEFLKLHSWSSEKIDVYLVNYQKYLPMIRHLLNASTFGFSHIVDADWRLDYYIKSDTISKVGQPQYYLKLKVKDELGAPRDVNFVCTIEQLQDMVNKLQDAAHSINRLDLS